MLNITLKCMVMQDAIASNFLVMMFPCLYFNKNFSKFTILYLHKLFGKFIVRFSATLTTWHYLFGFE